MSNVFMKINNIPGNVFASPYQGWIGIESIHFETRRKIVTRIGQSSDREGVIPQVSELLISKQLDKASNPLFAASCTGKSIGEVEIHVCTTNKNLTPYIKYTFENVIVSHYEHMVSAQALPGELIRLNFTKMIVAYIEQNEQLQSSSPHVVGYDLASGQMI